MRKLLMGSVLGIAVMTAWTTPVSAASISWSLDCTLSAAGCTTSGPWGTITIADNLTDANWLDITVTLDESAALIQALYLNYDDSQFSDSTPFVLSPSIDVSEDAAKANGYAGWFDIEIPDSGNLAGNPWVGTLSLAGTNLDPSMFAFTDETCVTTGTGRDRVTTCVSTNIFYAAVKVTAPGGTTINTPSWIGTSGATPPPPPPPPVPEPGSLALLGLGLIGVAHTLRKRS